MSRDGVISQFIENRRPPLIKLTQIGIPTIDEGLPTSAYIDPSMIVLVSRAKGGGATTGDGQPIPGSEHRPVTCIWLYPNHHLLVLETPDVVALRRERAMNNVVKPTAVSEGEENG